MSFESLNTQHTTVLQGTDGGGSTWLIPRIFNSIIDAIDQQALEYLESVDAIKNGTAVDDSLETPIFLRVVQNLNYFVSPYAAACMIMAIVLNRTIAFAGSTSHNRNRLNNVPKVLFRGLAIIVLGSALWDVVKVASLNIGWVHRCLSFVYTVDGKQGPVGSLLWKVFISFCVSNFIETLISINSGQLPFYDTALTLFEYSLASQESRYLRVPTPQLLFILASSVSNQIIVHIFGLFNLKRYQLIPSAVFGVNLIGLYLVNVYLGQLHKLPLILIMSILPQIVVLLVTVICMTIYTLAVFVNGTSRGLTYTPMLNNLSESLNFQLSEDFNSLITRFGLIMFNALDNEENLNEYSSLRLKKTTYLEDNKKSYLISTYFNNIEENPDSKLKKEKASNSISTVWSFIKRYINLFNLSCQLCRFIFDSLFSSKRKIQKNTRTSQPRKFPSTVSTLRDLKFNSVSNDSLSNDQTLFSELQDDESMDFQYESDSELDPFEYDSELSEDEEGNVKTRYISTISEQRLLGAAASTPPPAAITSSVAQQLTKAPLIEELFQPTDVLSLISPSRIEDYSQLRYIRAHLSKDTRLTRSRFANLNQDDILRDLILEKSRPRARPRPAHTSPESDVVDHDHDDGEIDEIACVVCQTNHRSIVLWPCKCFAVCDNCRLSLGVRGFNHCVCCRRKVEGFTKLYIP
jgi:hypothetical protein